MTGKLSRITGASGRTAPRWRPSGARLAAEPDNRPQPGCVSRSWHAKTVHSGGAGANLAAGTMLIWEMPIKEKAMQNKPFSLIPAAFLALCLQPAQSKPQSFIAEAYGHPQHLVRVEGTGRLNLVCVGKGEPAAILLYGLGSGSYDWRKVQPAIGQITTVCTYDRAGQGFSDPSNRPSDATNAILDLHALLHAAGLSKRIVLVGHSLGGLYATLYAETYPEDIAGMVLVEPAFSGQGQAIAEAVGTKAAHQLAAGQVQIEAALAQCITMAKLGQLSDPAGAKSDCLDNPPDADPDLHQEKDRELKSADYEIALGSEYHNANIVDRDGRTLDDIESKRTGASLGSIPLVVLTRGNVEKMGGLTPEEQSRAEAAWRAGHDRLAALSSRGTNINVPQAGHFIQLDQPGIVIEQIERMVKDVRG
jgi:pimeloyl-ACP methyl ester carboxylesterase